MSTRHIADLLARSFDEELSEAERASIIQHLATCEECRSLQGKLRRADARLSSAGGLTSSLRPLDTARRAPSVLGSIALTGAVLVVALIVGNVLYTQRVGQPAQSAEPSVAVAPSPSALRSPRATEPAISPFFLLLARTATGDTTAGAISRIDIVSVNGEIRSSHDLAAMLGAPVYDGATRLAYWRRGATGTVNELVVWDMARDTARVIYQTESQASVPIWSAARDQLVFVLENGALPENLVVVDATSGSDRELVVYTSRPTVDPIYADDRVIAGYVRTGGYEVVDAHTGQLLSSFPTSSFVGYGGTQTSRDGMVVELKTNFEAPSRPLYVWRAEAPNDPVAVVQQGELHDPVFRPGRTELYYGDGFDLRVLEYHTGRSGLVHAFPRTAFGWPTPIAFDDTGEHLLVRSHVGLQIFAIRGQQFELVSDARLAEPRALVLGLIQADNLN